MWYSFKYHLKKLSVSERCKLSVLLGKFMSVDPLKDDICQRLDDMTEVYHLKITVIILSFGLQGAIYQLLTMCNYFFVVSMPIPKEGLLVLFFLSQLNCQIFVFDIFLVKILTLCCKYRYLFSVALKFNGSFVVPIRKCSTVLQKS